MTIRARMKNISKKIKIIVDPRCICTDCHSMKKVVIPNLSEENYRRLRTLATKERRAAGAQAQVIVEAELEKIFAKGAYAPKSQEVSK